MGRTIRFETNHPEILKHVVGLFARYPRVAHSHHDFLWKIVVEPAVQYSPLWPPRSAFSDEGLRFVTFGQRNFLAVDLEVKEAIGILCEGLMRDEIGLTIPFLDSMFCLTASSLGLVPLWANCVAHEQTGVVLFGGSNSGKTCASYTAEKLGLKLHADDGVFIDIDSGVLRSWGGFWPAGFRPEALKFLPELAECTRPCRHQDFTFFYRTKPPIEITCGLPVTPVCCLFLERAASETPRLGRVSPGQVIPLLAEYALFKDEKKFFEGQSKVVEAVAELPAYLLRYGDDPAIAAVTARDLLLNRGVHSLNTD